MTVVIQFYAGNDKTIRCIEKSHFVLIRMDFIVDFQGFKKSSDEFVIKELAILSINDSTEHPVTFLFEPPCAWTDLSVKYKRMNLWLERNYHGISWNSGRTPYRRASEILRTILQHARIICVKGLERSKWLESIIGKSSNIVNLDDIGCPSLHKLRKKSSVAAKCSHHSNVLNYSCSTENVQLLKKQLLEPYNSL